MLGGCHLVKECWGVSSLARRCLAAIDFLFGDTMGDLISDLVLHLGNLAICQAFEKPLLCCFKSSFVSIVLFCEKNLLMIFLSLLTKHIHHPIICCWKLSLRFCYDSLFGGFY